MVIWRSSMLIAPNADPSDGLFDVLIIGDISKSDLLLGRYPDLSRDSLTHPKLV